MVTLTQKQLNLAVLLQQQASYFTDYFDSKLNHLILAPRRIQYMFTLQGYSSHFAGKQEEVLLAVFLGRPIKNTKYQIRTVTRPFLYGLDYQSLVVSHPPPHIQQ